MTANIGKDGGLRGFGYETEDEAQAAMDAVLTAMEEIDELRTDHPIVNRPADLPELRQWLIEQWRPGHLYSRMATTMHEHSRGHLPNDFSPLETGFDPVVLREARLYYVTIEMCALIQAAAKTLLPVTLTEDLPPCPYGAVFYETPLIGIAAEVTDTSDHLPVRITMWGESRVPSLDRALGIASYGDFNGVLSPCGRTDWVYGDDTDEPPDESFEELPEPERRLQSMAEDRRWMATFWLLLAENRVADTHIDHPQRAALRRAQRRDPFVTRDGLAVRVVNVRAPKSSTSNGEGRDVNWSHRWIVGGETGGFWRQQAYGPNRSLRRPKFIVPYVKGPDDKPLIIKDTVHVLKGN